MSLYSDEYFMNLALKEAKKSIKSGDVPVGAVIVLGDSVISKGSNQVEKNKDSLAHAELTALKKAMKKVGYKHLTECKLYVTLEPCAMCSGAIVLSRMKELIIGCLDPKTGASGSLYQITDDGRLNHRCKVKNGVLENESSKLLKDFFIELRKRKK